MIELKGFSRFTKEAVEEGSNQELDSIKEGFLKSLNGDEVDEEKEGAISKYTDVKKAKKCSALSSFYQYTWANSNYELLHD